MTLPSGSRLGTYEIVDLLGVGGMGEVYRARDRKLGREVAIKVLPEEYSKDSDLVARFEREARMLASVNHPTIAAIYGAEQDGPTRYIVMELVEGETLAQRLASGPLAIPDALRISSQIAEALEVAHEKGVIHRDLKPANIKITPEGKVKVLDFGLAKAMELPFAVDISTSPTLVMSDSRPGQILGTPEFMSPEQARGKETDRRTDIWAFGCILFEALSGKRAFTGETVPDVVGAILHVDPDWASLPARTPELVRELLRMCLEKDPGRRLRDAGDARLEIESALAGMSGAGAATAAGRSGRWKTLAAVAAGAALALVAYLFVRPKILGPSPVSAIRQLAVLPFLNLTNTPEGEMWGLALAETVSARLSNVNGLQVVTPRAPAEAADPNASIASVVRRLGANTLLKGSLQRENDRFRITYRLLDATGAQIAANTMDGSAIFALQDRVADSVVKDLRLRRGAQRTPTPSGLDTPAEQQRYLEAIGLLRRYDLREGVAKALAILRKLAEEKPNSALVQAALARADLETFRTTKERVWADRAIAASDAARGIDPGLPEVDVTVGETLLETGRSKEAVQAFRRALAARPGDVQALLGLGRSSEFAGDPTAAEEAFRRAIELEPSFAVFNQLAVLYYDLGRYGDAAEMFRRAARAAPDSPRALSNLGGTETMRCNYPAALEAYKKALQIDPNYPSAISNLGMTLLWTGHPVEAAASLERAAREKPADFQIRGNLGDAYRAQGDPRKAGEAYATSIALSRAQLGLNPNDATAMSYAATGLAKTGHPAEAQEQMRGALVLDQKDPNILSDAAIVAAIAGRDAEAIAFLRRAVDAGYCREIITRQPEFARLQQNPEFRSIIAAPQKAAGN
jgi:Flp pilus assembly protein TadD/TolB-like protein